jgi:hypothetical protein
MCINILNHSEKIQLDVELDFPLGREIDDFIDYWIPRLREFEYYSILPQTKSIIEEVVILNLSKEPDNILRLFYDIKGHDDKSIELSEPTIEPFDRDGYFVTEWGVIY